jgi:hypothetical protein
MMREKKMLPVHMFLCIACLFLFVGCGKKGNPTMKSFEKPAVVQQMRAIHRDGKVTISWSYPRQARIVIKGFYVERATGAEPYQNIGFVKGDTLQYVDEHFETGREYRYKVRVYSMRDVISDDSPVLKVMPLRLPDPPVGLSYYLTNDSIEITWDKAVDGVVYNIYRSPEKGKYSASPINATPLEKPFYQDGVDVGKPVFYTVRSLVISTVNNEGGPSADIEIDPQSFIPARPTDLRYVRSQNKAYIFWKENAETWVKAFRIYCKVGLGEYIPVAEVSVPLFIEEDPVSSPSSYYVTAVGPIRESAPSDVLSVKP